MGNSTLEMVQAPSCLIYSDLLKELKPFWITHFVAVINCVLCLIAVLGNVLILVALHNCLLHPPSKLLFRCLASTDLCVGFISQPSFVISLISEIEEHLSLCRISGHVVYISSATLCGVSLCILTMISVDRLLALLLGLRYRHVVTLARVRAIAILLWLLLSALSILYFWSQAVFMIILCVIVLLCLAASTVCYSKIYFALRYRQALVSQQSEHGGPNMPTRTRWLKYKRSVSTTVWVYMTLIACYLPFAVVQIVRAMHGDTLSLVVAQGCTTSLVYLNSTINPAIYCWRMKEVRQAVKAAIRRFFSFCF